MFKSTYLFSKTVLLLLVTNPAILYVKADFDADILCTYIANGTKIKDPGACNIYITCVDQKPIYGTCGDLFYDRNTRSCVVAGTIICYSSDPCASTAGINGFVADPYSCNSYYYCLDGVANLGECTLGLNFNPESSNCIRNYNCEITMLPDDYCNIVPDGVFIKVPGSCSAYKMCWQGTLLNGTCPDTFYLNVFTGQCDYPSNVVCDPATTVAPKIPENIKCTKSNVFISDGRTCNGYYYCRGNANGTYDLVHGNCPISRFFDPSNEGACVPRTIISCPYNRCVTMGLDYIQLANVENDGCTGFSICQNGEEIAKSSCPPGEYYDEMLQRCTTEAISYAACAFLTTTTTSTTTLEDNLITSTETDADEELNVKLI